MKYTDIQMTGIIREDDTPQKKAVREAFSNMIIHAAMMISGGLGFLLILNAWHEKHWLEPQLIEQPELMQVKLELKIVNADESIGSQNESINEPI